MQPLHSTLIEENPALSRLDFFPDPAPWPELAELREQHLRILGERNRAGQALMELRARFEREDEDVASARQAGYLAGTAPAIGSLTPLPEREAALGEAEADLRAAFGALAAFAEDALVQMRADGRQSMQRMAELAGVAEAKRAEARRLLAEANAETADLERLETWIARVSGRGLIMLVAWGHLQPTDEPEDEGPALIPDQWPANVDDLNLEGVTTHASL